MKYTILFLLITGFLLALLAHTLPASGLGRFEVGNMLRLIMIGAMVSGSVVYFYQRRPGQALQHGLIWLLIAFLCVALYAGKDAIRATLIPGSVIESGDTLTIRRADDGHFYLNILVNGKAVRFMVDTGASSITIPVSAAHMLGISTEHLAFTQMFNTANGQTFGAPITLDSLALGTHVFKNVPAYVNQGELGTPLLGIRFLDRAKSLEIRDDALIIHF